jgi:hypothetical protein
MSAPAVDQDRHREPRTANVVRHVDGLGKLRKEVAVRDRDEPQLHRRCAAGPHQRSVRLGTLAERIHEVLPGVLHWPARYPTAGAGSAWARRSAPRGTGMHELPADRVQPYDFRDVLSVGIRPHAISATSPDETARDPLIPAVAIADGVINSDGLGFLADFLLGDDHDAENQRLRDGFARLAAEVDFDHLLLAHGPPIVGDGRERLRAFAASRPRPQPPARRAVLAPKYAAVSANRRHFPDAAGGALLVISPQRVRTAESHQMTTYIEQQAALPPKQSLQRYAEAQRRAVGEWRAQRRSRAGSPQASRVRRPSI